MRNITQTELNIEDAFAQGLFDVALNRPEWIRETFAVVYVYHVDTMFAGYALGKEATYSTLQEFVEGVDEAFDMLHAELQWLE